MAGGRGLTDICPGISAPLSPTCPPITYRKLNDMASKLAGNDHPIEGSFVMKLYVDTSAKNITVSKDPVEKNDQNGRQKVERGKGRPMWSTQVFVLDGDGGEVIAITTAGEKPNVRVGQV